MASAQDILNEIKEKDVKYVDVRFTDIRGRMQHVTFDIDLVDEEFLTDGTMFDGSSIAGWKAINESDMKLRPDLDTAYIDPFYQQTTLCLFCDIVNPDTGTPYNRDPRSIAKAALNYVKSAGIGDTVFFGPEAEFFIFDDVRWSTDPHNTGYSYDSTELPANTGKSYAEGNMGHRPGPKGGYFPVNPVDSAQDLRGEMLAVMGELGMKPEKHHHEVAPAQHELGLKFDTMIVMADRMQLYKYVIHNVAAAYGKSATFMAKPMFADNGSGMHV
ncbi:MAG: glutamine synthetase, partial [Alphaproteobacteria bacterium]